MLNWSCLVCGKEATVLGVAIKEVAVNHHPKIFSSSTTGSEFVVNGYTSIDGNCEFMPYCEEHNLLQTNNFILRCDLSERQKAMLSERFPVQQINTDRDIQL